MSQGQNVVLTISLAKSNTNALKELEKGIDPKDVEYFISYSISASIHSI